MGLRGLIGSGITAVLLSVALPPAMAEEISSRDALIQDFTMQPETRWRFFTDQVMGGVSPEASPLRGKTGRRLLA